MLTKAIIKETPKTGDNHYKVRIPLFEDTTGTEVIFDALCCHAPGIFNGYNPGDIVYVVFEDAKLNIPVIIGRLYVEEQDDYSKGYFNNMEVATKAHLPMATTFGDGLSIGTLYDTLQYLNVQGALITSEGPANVQPSTTLPLMDGIARVGTEQRYAHGDHQHPTDTTKDNVWTSIWTGTKKADGTNISPTGGLASYKYLRIWVHAYNVCFPVMIDLTKKPAKTPASEDNSVYRGAGCAPVYSTSDNRVEYYFCAIEVNGNTITIPRAESSGSTNYQIGYSYITTGQKCDVELRGNNDYYYIYKVEGQK